MSNIYSHFGSSKKTEEDKRVPAHAGAEAINGVATLTDQTQKMCAVRPTQLYKDTLNVLTKLEKTLRSTIKNAPEEKVEKMAEQHPESSSSIPGRGPR